MCVLPTVTGNWTHLLSKVSTLGLEELEGISSLILALRVDTKAWGSEAGAGCPGQRQAAGKAGPGSQAAGVEPSMGSYIGQSSVRASASAQSAPPEEPQL